MRMDPGYGRHEFVFVRRLYRVEITAFDSARSMEKFSQVSVSLFPIRSSYPIGRSSKPANDTVRGRCTGVVMLFKVQVLLDGACLSISNSIILQ